MFTKGMLEAFKKQYNEEHGENISDEQALAVALFENSILQTQQFIFALEKEIGELDSDKKWRLSEDIFNYSLSLIFIYLHLNNKNNSLEFMSNLIKLTDFELKTDNLNRLILNEYEKHIKKLSGAANKEQEKEIIDFFIKKLTNTISGLSMGLSSPYWRRGVIDEINSKVSYVVPFSYRFEKNIIEVLILGIESSMKHFGVIT